MQSGVKSKDELLNRKERAQQAFLFWLIKLQAGKPSLCIILLSMAVNVLKQTALNCPGLSNFGYLAC